MGSMRRYIDIVTESAATSGALTFDDAVRGSHSGQRDMTLSALLDGEVVGWIDYSVWRGEVAIQMIKVPKLKRRKIASALLRHLQSLFPETEIAWGGMTPDGAALKASVPTRTVDVPDMRAHFDRLASLRARDAELRQIADRFEQHPSEANRAALLAVGDEWNAIHSEVADLEDGLHGQSPTRTLIDI